MDTTFYRTPRADQRRQTDRASTEPDRRLSREWERTATAEAGGGA